MDRYFTDHYHTTNKNKRTPTQDKLNSKHSKLTLIWSQTKEITQIFKGQFEPILLFCIHCTIFMIVLKQIPLAKIISIIFNESLLCAKFLRMLRTLYTLIHLIVTISSDSHYHTHFISEKTQPYFPPYYVTLNLLVISTLSWVFSQPQHWSLY